MPADISLAGIDVALVDAVSRERTMKSWLELIMHEYDYVLIDYPPSSGMMSINALTASHEAIIPVQPQYLSIKGMTQPKEYRVLRTRRGGIKMGSAAGNHTGEWRYRIGDFRVLCDIQDDRLVVLAFKVDYRSKVYKRQDKRTKNSFCQG